jgi:hypothetical protein
MQTHRIEANRICAGLLGGNAEELEHVRKTPRGVSAAAEAEQINPIAGLPDTDDRGVVADFRGPEGGAGRKAGAATTGGINPSNRAATGCSRD